jgi:hypothetical protein
MNSQAGIILNWFDAHKDASSEEKHEHLAQVPAWQWSVRGGHWAELAKHCCNRVEPELLRRPVNGLNIEIGAPQPRCLFRSPDGRGFTKNGGSLDWYLSGGSVLDYGHCQQSECYWGKGPKEKDV